MEESCLWEEGIEYGMSWPLKEYVASKAAGLAVISSVVRFKKEPVAQRKMVGFFQQVDMVFGHSFGKNDCFCKMHFES